MGTRTTHFNFNLPADDDYASQAPFNDNFTELDAILFNVVPQAAESTIDNTALASFFEGTMTGELAAEITGSSALAGVVRAYKTSSTDSIQIAEAIDGTRVTRYYTSSAWSSWA